MFRMELALPDLGPANEASAAAANNLAGRPPLRFLSNAHRNSCYPADDFRLRWIVKPSDILSCVWMRNDDQLSMVDLAPTANIAVAEFDKIDRTVKLGLPFLGADLSLSRINLH